MTFNIVPVRLSRGWSFSMQNQWPAVFRPATYNWVDFTFIQAEIEHECAMSNWNATFAFLGFQLFVSYCYYKPDSPTPAEQKP